MTDPQDSEVDRDERREREVDESRATPVRHGGSPLHGRDTADAVRPERTEFPPPDRRDPDEEGLPTEGRPR